MRWFLGKKHGSEKNFWSHKKIDVINGRVDEMLENYLHKLFLDAF